VSVLADAAREAEGAGLDGPGKHLYTRLDDGDLLHPALGLVVLLAIQVLNVYKPQGMTRYGQRKQAEERAARCSGASTRTSEECFSRDAAELCWN
jgi:hypothetical protein